MKSILFFDDEPYTAIAPFLDHLQIEKINYIVVNKINQVVPAITSTNNFGLIVIDLHHSFVIDDTSHISSVLDIIKTYLPEVPIAVYTNFNYAELPDTFKMLYERGITTILSKSMNLIDVFQTFCNFVRE